MKQNKLHQNLTVIFGILMILIGIYELIISYYGYRVIQSILHSSSLFSKSSSMNSGWDIIWSLHVQLTFGIMALFSGIVIFYKNTFTWSVCVATCLVLCLKHITLIFQYQFGKEIEVDPGIGSVEKYFFILWLIPIIVSILGLVLLFTDSAFKKQAISSKQWYMTSVFTAILIFLIFFI